MITQTIDTTDYHTAGEPFRIVADVPVPLPGDSVADRRARAVTSTAAQALRQTLCSEPRGHADMYGGFIVPPDDAGAHLGVLFWHKDGFSTACGHGTIALGAWAVDTGLVAAPDDGVADVVVDVPSGRVTARVHRAAGRTVAVDFVNVPSYVLARDLPVQTSRGEASATLVYGGAIYASVDATALGLSVDPASYGDLIAVGREIKRALDAGGLAVHPTDPRLSGVYGTILYEEVGDPGGGDPGSGPGVNDGPGFGPGNSNTVHQRNVTVFADGQVDRSPCGSGTAARLAALADDGRVGVGGAILRHESIVGSEFTGTIVGTTRVGDLPAVIPQVTGMAYRTGEHRFVVDDADPLVPGFVLR